MYDVVLLMERPLSTLDADQVTGLHTDIEDTVRYHVLLPTEDISGRLQVSMGSLLPPDGMTPAPPLPEEDARELAQEAADESRENLQASVDRLAATGRDVDGRLITSDPIDALTTVVKELGAAEAIILTEPHVVKEFFGLDWTTRARRHLDVPLLHLLERETFEEQGRGGGEGAGVI